jgi:hypothetical protein
VHALQSVGGCAAVEGGERRSAGPAMEKRLWWSDRTQNYGYPKTMITSDYHNNDGFLDLFLWRKTTTKTKEYSTIYLREGKRPEIKTISSHTHQPGHFRLAGSLPEWFWAHARTKSQGHSLPRPLAWLLPIHVSCMHNPSPSFSPFVNVTCSPCLIKGRARSSQEAL